MIRDPFDTVELEESILSSMIGVPPRKGFKVVSLGPEHFTNRLRASIYELLRGGWQLDKLDAELLSQGFSANDLYYISDLYLVPSYTKVTLPEAIADLKRLTLLRGLCDAVDRWRAAAPYMTYEKALKDLSLALRG